MIIDAHVHAWQRWPYRSPAIPGFDVDGLLATMDAHDVDHAMVVAARIDPDDERSANPENNAWLADSVRRFGDRLSLLADLDSRWSVDYHRPGVVQRLDELAELPIVGVAHYLAEDDDGWLEGTEADALLGSLADRGLLLSLHAPPVWHPSIERALRRHPGVRVLLHHLGLAGSGQRHTVLEMTDLEHVYLKVSGMYYLSEEPYPFPAASRWLRELTDKFGADRLLWGSDHPISARRGYSYQQMLTAVSWLSEQERDAMLGGTAARLLGVSR